MIGNTVVNTGFFVTGGRQKSDLQRIKEYSAACKLYVKYTTRLVAQCNILCGLAVNTPKSDTLDEQGRLHLVDMALTLAIDLKARSMKVTPNEILRKTNDVDAIIKYIRRKNIIDIRAIEQIRVLLFWMHYRLDAS